MTWTVDLPVQPKLYPDKLEAVGPLMPVQNELWVVTAGPDGGWLIPRDPGDGLVDAWRSGLVLRDDEPWDVARRMLQDRGEWRRRCLLHGASCRTDRYADGDNVDVRTWIAVLGTFHDTGPGGRRGYRSPLELWPDAEQIELQEVLDIGPPPAHGPTDNPAPRRVDALFHALGHVAWLLQRNPQVTEDLDRWMRQFLRGMEPFLASMYQPYPVSQRVRLQLGADNWPA